MKYIRKLHAHWILYRYLAENLIFLEILKPGGWSILPIYLEFAEVEVEYMGLSNLAPASTYIRTYVLSYRLLSQLSLLTYNTQLFVRICWRL